MTFYPSIEIQAAPKSVDPFIAAHFYQMWLDNGVDPINVIANWQEQVLQFIEMARRELDYQAFVAIAAGQVVGSVSCQRLAGLYPLILKQTERCDGYIWGVYVEPTYRQQGIGTQLTQRSIDYLRSIGCTQVILNASPFGRPVYEKLGFEDSNLMRLRLGRGVEE